MDVRAYGRVAGDVRIALARSRCAFFGVHAWGRYKNAFENYGRANQMRSVNDSAADIQENVQPELWDRQMRWTFKRDTWISLIGALNAARRSLLILTELRGEGREIRSLAEYVLSGLHRANRDIGKTTETLSQQLDLASLVISKDVVARIRALIGRNQNRPEMLIGPNRRLEEFDQAIAEVVGLAKIDLQLENESRFDGAKAS